MGEDFFDQRPKLRFHSHFKDQSLVLTYFLSKRIIILSDGVNRIIVQILKSDRVGIGF